MEKKNTDPNYLILIASSVVVTLSLTSWVNVDALVIPKVILLFGTAMYFIPIILVNIKFLLTHLQFKILLLLVICMIIQMVLVMMISVAPLEQQVFGKTGRGLGFLVEMSLLVVVLVSAQCVSLSRVKLLVNGLVIAALISSFYSILQRFGLDIFTWYSRTNGIIGTLGNPNFQSAIAAMAIVPTITYFWQKQMKQKMLSLILISILLYTIYICQSTQGYIITAISACIYFLIFIWYKNRLLFAGLSVLTIFAGIVSIFGMLNMGPFARFLFKPSVTSRGEFMRTAVSTIQDNPAFGVGLDSFGDVSTFYKSAKDAAGINEFTDNAHNYILQYAATGGIPLALLYILILILTFACFIILQKRTGKFDFTIAAIFSSWLGFQSQTLISPGAIPIMMWGAIMSGSLIGLSVFREMTSIEVPIKSNNIFKPFSYFFLFISLIITYPLFNADRLQLKSNSTGDGLLAIKSAKMYPQSVVRYQRIGIKLLESNLPQQALDLGRSAVKFNPNSVSSWALILANGAAPIEERELAQREILRLDPFNSEIRNLKLRPVPNP